MVNYSHALLIRKTAKFVLFASAGVLTACATSQPTNFNPSSAVYPVQVAESIERLELYTRPNGLELSARDTDAVALFLGGYQRFGSGPIVVNVPSNSANGLGTQQAKALIGRMLANGGASPTALQTQHYASAPGVSAPVVVSYRTLKTMPRDCRFMGSLTMTGSNQPSDSFGCSQSSNLAAMISDPRQLIEPLPYGHPNAQRRMEVYDKYIEGADPSSEQPERQVVSAEGDG